MYGEVESSQMPIGKREERQEGEGEIEKRAVSDYREASSLLLFGGMEG